MTRHKLAEADTRILLAHSVMLLVGKGHPGEWIMPWVAEVLGILSLKTINVAAIIGGSFGTSSVPSTTGTTWTGVAAAVALMLIVMTTAT